MSQLSDEAAHILHIAVDKQDDTIMLLDSLGGTILQVGGDDLLDGLDPRAQARHRSAVQELLRAGLIEDRTGKGEVFFLTGAGYDVEEQSRTP